MTEKRVLSHIQIPKTVLKEFSDENNTIFYWDFSGEKVKRDHAKSLYTQLGYYSSTMEKWLSGEIETALGKLVEALRKTDFERPQDLPTHYEAISFKYLYSLISRSPNMVDELKNDSVFFQLLDATSQHDIAAHDCYNIAIEKGFLSNYYVDIVHNITESPFVLASSGMCVMKAGILCPITPLSAILFSQKDPLGDCIRLHEIHECELINKINRNTYEQEKRSNERFIFSSSQQVLENVVGNML